MADAGDLRVRGFSAGMRKRVALARILLAAPSLVLLDEPHAALDPDGMALVDRMLDAWRGVGVTVLIASHAVERIGEILDGTVHLDGGLVAEVTGRGVTSRPPAIARLHAGHRRSGAMSGVGRTASAALAIARKDALAELRGKHAATSTLFFAAVVLLLFGFALGPDSRKLADAAPGLLWLAMVFAGLLTVARLHAVETDDDALEQLALYPIDRRAIYVGKVISGLLAMLVLGAVLLVAVTILYGMNLGPALPALLLTVLLGALGFAAVGTFYAGVTVRMGAREVMLPLLMLPIVAPLLLAAVKATGAALSGDPSGELGAWLQLLAGFDIVMLVAGAGTYGFLLEDV